MNLHDAATSIPSSHEQHHEADTRLYGRWLLLARIGWFALVVLTLSVSIATFSEYVVRLQTVCRQAFCSLGQLSPDSVVALEHFGLSVSSYATFIGALTISVALVFLATGGLIYWRKSDDWMGLLFALIFVVGGMSFLLLTLGTSHSAWPLPVKLVVELLWLLFFLAFTLFPDGRFVPSFTRWLLVVFCLLSVIYVFFTNPYSAPLWIAVPLTVLFYSLFVGLAIAQMYRYRYVSTLLQRQQTKWVLYGLTANIVVGGPVLLLTLFFPRSLYPLIFPLVFNCALLLYPFTIGIAIFRYRLWDIDVLINRTLVYGTLSVILTAVYVGVVLGLQALLRGIISQNSGVAIVISTLAIAALFQPFRSRIQKIIDRRFYRSKYDATKIVEAFSATLRNEVDLNHLSDQLVTVVEETMHPTFVSLWLRPPEHDGKRRAHWKALPSGSSEDT